MAVTGTRSRFALSSPHTKNSGAFPALLSCRKSPVEVRAEPGQQGDSSTLCGFGLTDIFSCDSAICV